MLPLLTDPAALAGYARHAAARRRPDADERLADIVLGRWQGRAMSAADVAAVDPPVPVAARARPRCTSSASAAPG